MDGERRDNVKRIHAIGELIRRLAWSRERIDHMYAAREDLHPTDLRALIAIYRAELDGSPLTPRALHQELCLSPGAITYAVARLVESGHVVRERDPADGRRTLLRYAQAGLDVAVGFLGPLALAQVQSLEDFEDADLEAASRVLAAAYRGLHEFEDGLQRGERTCSPSKR